MSATHQHPLLIKRSGYLDDHRAEGRSVLPATEALSILGCVAQTRWPACDPTRSAEAEFQRFLELPAGGEPLEAAVELEPLDEAGAVMRAALVTRSISGSGIARTRSHVRAVFGGAGELSPAPLDVLAAPEGVCLSFPAERLYADLVPFGPSFHNATGEVHLGADGALGRVRAAELPAPCEPLGSIFPLDAAFHLACAWGQRHAGAVTFPVGYGRRRVWWPCRPGESFVCRILARPPTAAAELRFDLWLLDDDGRVREAVSDLRMQDIFRGRTPVAPWVRAGSGDPLTALRTGCLGVAVIELAAVAPFAPDCLSSAERTRFQSQGERRRVSFVAARLALKRLAREQGIPADRLPQELHTVADDGLRPCCPAGSVFASAAHDGRFAVAAVAESPVGIDVEPVSQRVLRIGRLALTAAERERVQAAKLGPARAATRVWVCKEAIAKATGCSLAEALRRVELSEIGDERCRARFDGRWLEIPCAEVDGHVFARVLLGD